MEKRRRGRRSDQACRERLKSRCSSQDSAVLWSDGAIGTDGEDGIKVRCTKRVGDFWTGYSVVNAQVALDESRASIIGGAL